MEAAIDYRNLAPHPRIPPTTWACPNSGNDFQTSKLAAIDGSRFRLYAGKPMMEDHFGIRRSFLVSNFVTM